MKRRSHRKKIMGNRRRKKSPPASQSNFGTIPDPIGPDDLARLNEGLAWLFVELREANNRYHNGTDGGRDAAIVAIRATTAFLMLFSGVDKESLFTPLAFLANALTALNSNVVEPMLKPLPSRGRAPASEGRQSFKGFVTYTVCRLQDFGMDDKSSRRVVAKQLKMLGIKPDRGSGDLTARTLREWRQAIAADVGRHSDAAKTLDSLLADAENETLNKLSREEAIQAMLNKLAYVTKQVRAGDLV
jgi:hypothetical protein